jgi:transcriptional regulator with XRE-family HTH domain
MAFLDSQSDSQQEGRFIMTSHSQVSEPVFQTVTGGQISLSRLSDVEYEFLDIIFKKYNPKLDWTRFAAWWNAKFNAIGLPTTSVVHRICQDLEARLGIKQGKVSLPDYRDFLAELIDSQFASRQEFCRATGVDPGQLSRVLAKRDNLSLKVLPQILEVLDAQLVIQTEEESRAQTSIDQAITALAAVLRQQTKRPASSPTKSQGFLSTEDSEKEGMELPNWRKSFPNVHNIEKVADHARSVAEAWMPLMIPVAA